MEIKTRYDVDAEVFFMDNNKMQRGYIKQVEVHAYQSNLDGATLSINYYLYGVESPFTELNLYSTKEALIASL